MQTQYTILWIEAKIQEGEVELDFVKFCDKLDRMESLDY